MRALVLSEVERFGWLEIDDPEPGPGQVRIAVLQAGICGSELGGFLGTDGLRHPGLVFGHEFIGTIDRYGAGPAAGHRLPEGTLVTANPLRSCHSCTICRSGHANVCPHRELLGAHLNGSNAEYVVVASGDVIRLDGLTDPDAGVFAEPTACALRAVRRVGLLPGSPALVLGAGTIGLQVLELLRYSGVDELYFTEPNPGRVRAAEATAAVRLSSDPAELADQVRDATNGLGVGAVFDAVGTEQARSSAAALTRSGGSVCYLGLHAAQAALPVRDLIRREVTGYTSFAYSADEFAQAVALLGRGEVAFRGGVIRAPMADGQQWYERLIAGHHATKVLLEPRPRAAS
jgi:threonine dehydrogenase-like Zn-dependent dehydrogenase